MTYDAPTTRAMALYPLNPGHSDLDNEQPMTVHVHDAWVRCTLGDIRKAQREAGLIGHAERQAGRVSHALEQLSLAENHRDHWIAEAQRAAADLGSALTRIALAASVALESAR